LTKKLKVSEKTRIVGFGDSLNDRDLFIEGVKEAYFVKNIEPDCLAWFNSNKE